MPEITPISPPSIRITQTTTGAATGAATPPSLPACIVGPCFRIVDAFATDGTTTNPDALLVAYRDGLGVVAAPLPQLLSTDDLTSLTDEIRVFIAIGTISRELNGVDDEEIILNAQQGAGSYNTADSVLTDATRNFSAIGVQVGDYIRLTWRGMSTDIEITTVTTTALTLAIGGPNESLSAIDYQVIRNPAEWVYNASVAASSARIGNQADWIQFDALPAGPIGGTDGDDVEVVIVAPPTLSEGNAWSGDRVFLSADAEFTISVGAAGIVSNKRIIVHTGLGAENDTVARAITRVINDTTLVLPTGTGSASDALYIVGTRTAGGVNGVSSGDGLTFTSAGATFFTLSGGSSGAPTVGTYVYITGSGVYAVTTVNSNTSLTLAFHADESVTDQTYDVITMTAEGEDGATGSNSTVAFTGINISDVSSAYASVSALAIRFPDASQGARQIDTIVNANTVSLDVAPGSALTSAEIEIVEWNADDYARWDGEEQRITITLNRSEGEVTSMFEDISSILTDEEDPGWNEDVANRITLTGDGDGETSVLDFVGTYVLDGGADVRSIRIDADLLGSTTARARVYISYRALRGDVGAGEDVDSPALLSFSTEAEVVAALGPISVRNPLALGLQKAILNAGGRIVYAFGVDTISADAPEGTPAAWQRSFDFLLGKAPYAYALLTTNPEVHQLAAAHADVAGSADNNAWSLFLTSPAEPTHSGDDGRLRDGGEHR